MEHYFFEDAILRVFDPQVDGQALDFRLVGMDHFNAMLEDQASGTWWAVGQRSPRNTAVSPALSMMML